MICKISDKILLYLLQCNVIEKDETTQTYYKYGIEITISSILNILLIVILGVIFNRIVESLFFLATFILLRQFTGGYHANTYFKCNLYFCITFLSVLLLSHLSMFFIDSYISILVTISTALFILLACPIQNKNKPIPAEKRLTLKLLAGGLSCCFGGLSIFLVSISNTYGIVIIFTMISVVLLGLIEKIKERSITYEK